MNIFIGCASGDVEEKYLLLAKNVSDYLANRNYNLVFGTYSKSMMGECYKAFKNKKIIAVSLPEYEIDFKNMPELEVKLVNNNFKRLNYIFDNSDTFLILPGGTGTYSELFGIIEEFKFYKEKKKLILFNYEGFYDKLIDFIKDNINNNFIKETDIDNIIIVNSLEEMERLI